VAETRWILRSRSERDDVCSEHSTRTIRAPGSPPLSSHDHATSAAENLASGFRGAGLFTESVQLRTHLVATPQWGNPQASG
jgi:hypothetical protein